MLMAIKSNCTFIRVTVYKNASGRNGLKMHYRTAASCLTRQHYSHVQYNVKRFNLDALLMQFDGPARGGVGVFCMLCVSFVVKEAQAQRRCCGMAANASWMWQWRFKEHTQRALWSKECFICEFCCSVECQRRVMTEIWCEERDGSVSDDPFCTKQGRISRESER